MLIAFEGVDGAGKTTLARVVVDQLLRERVSIEYVEKKGLSFSSAYVQRHMATLKSVLWDYAPDDPLQELGDSHWLHLQASWFAALDHCRIRPALAKGTLVVLDNWYFKIMARFFLKPNFDRAVVEHSLGYMTQPDMVFLLDLPAGVALARKSHLSISECGLLDGFSGRGSESFEAYQEKVRRQMLSMADSRGWIRLDASEQPEILAARCVTEIHQRLGRSVIEGKAPSEAQPQGSY